MLKARQFVADWRDLLAIQGRGREDRHPLADRHPLPDRFRAERAEQRREDAAGLERPQHCGVQLRHPADQAEHPIPGADPQVTQGVGEPVRAPLQFPVRDVDLALLGQAAQGDVLAASVRDMTVHCLVRDVDPAGRQPVEPSARCGPREGRAVVSEVGCDKEIRRILADDGEFGKPSHTSGIHLFGRGLGLDGRGGPRLLQMAQRWPFAQSAPV